MCYVDVVVIMYLSFRESFFFPFILFLNNTHTRFCFVLLLLIINCSAACLCAHTYSFLPGQEAGNVDVVLESQFGEYNNKPTEIASIVTSWLQDPTLLTKLSQSAMEAGNPYAADEIVNDIGSNTVAWMNLNKQ